MKTIKPVKSAKLQRHSAYDQFRIPLLSLIAQIHTGGSQCLKSPNTRPAHRRGPDHLAHDGQVAKDFYTGLFGWTYDDHPAGEGMVYTMFSHNGIPVCASAEAGPMQQNLPAHWSVYVTVDDLEASVERAKTAGGSVVFDPCDVLDVGRMAIIQDQEGAFPPPLASPQTRRRPARCTNPERSPGSNSPPPTLNPLPISTRRRSASKSSRTRTFRSSRIG